MLTARPAWIARAACIAAVAGALAARSATAQNTVAATPTFTLAGQILDALNERPIISAVVKIPELRRYAFSDVNGRFRFAEFPEGTWEIVVEMLGYETLDGSVAVSEGNGLLLRMNPDPVALAGLEVRTRSAGLLDRRRRRYPFRVTTIPPQTIADDAGFDPAAIFRRHANAFVTSCIDGSGFLTLGACYFRRARKTQITVFLNEGELLGGMNELSMFPARDIHSMDWLKDVGELHVYTHWFIERLNTTGTNLAPFKWPIG